MSTREPVAEIGAEDYRIVRHTHDVELARKLMQIALLNENGCPRWDWPASLVHTCTDECAADIDPGQPHQVWVRIVPCLPNSYGASEGWLFAYSPAQPGRGAFRAVEFR